MKNITLKTAILGMAMLFGASTLYAEEMKSDAMPMKSESMMNTPMKKMMKSDDIQMHSDHMMKSDNMMKSDEMGMKSDMKMKSDEKMKSNKKMKMTKEKM
ncbi:hypothetical protein [Haemophilus haemolyticus]|uniref:hypothetical protein n=1 Tax=Haemophilus haemolyticus TaxID=726 RepID=UPI00025E593E|nr:hypothetical protein [Haemophilus haemolyticus]EIJ74162.1 hypothetical protein HMPREF1053_0995 [Haemophilus haemolyticus HK386]OBX39446.1 hypothetical protein A8M50_04560 [Haemophilus haemolyticus]